MKIPKKISENPDEIPYKFVAIPTNLYKSQKNQKFRTEFHAIFEILKIRNRPSI
jgi:hypothetical protein